MTPALEQAAWLAVFAASVFASALASGVEIGCYSLNRVRLDLRADRFPPDPRAVLLRAELARPERLLVTLLIANNVVQYVSALATTRLFANSGLGDAGVALVGTLVLAPVLFVLGESLPKELFRIASDRLTYPLARSLAALRAALTWTGVLPAIRALTAVVERAAGLEGERLADARQRIAQLLKEGAGHGVISEAQVTLLDRAMALRGVTVGDEMVPWDKVRWFPADMDRERLLRRLRGDTHARVPAVDRTGRVVGVLKAIDLHARPAEAPGSLLRAPVRLRRTARVREALLQLRQSEARLGVVEDEAGRPLGIVTTKDLIEPLTGELAGL